MKTIVTGLLVLLLPLAVLAADKRDVRVVDAWARAVPAVAPVAGGFFTVINTGKATDQLLRVESPIAKRIEIHQMRSDGGVMRMRAQPTGVVVPAQGLLEFKPGGYHLMLIGPTRALIEGGHFEATLVFQRAGKVKVTFAVRGVGADS